MTEISDDVEVREIVAGSNPDRFARGWHCIGRAQDFRDGKPHQSRSSAPTWWCSRTARASCRCSTRSAVTWLATSRWRDQG